MIELDPIGPRPQIAREYPCPRVVASTDRIDPQVMKGFFEVFEGLLEDDPTVTVAKRGNRDPEMRQKAWIVAQTMWPNRFDAESFRIERFSIDLDVNENGLTVAAELMVGALEYYFRTRRGSRFASSLGKAGDINDFPFERLC